MNFFPTREKYFKLIDNQSDTIDRLNRRTEVSQHLTSQITSKSFRGIINGNEFRIISSTIGKGAFCVMTGSINAEKGQVKVEIHMAFKVLLSILLFLPLIGYSLLVLLRNTEDFSPIQLVVIILQVLVFRFVFIEIAFQFLSKTSLNRLRDVLDVEWINNKS